MHSSKSQELEGSKIKYMTQVRYVIDSKIQFEIDKPCNVINLEGDN